MQSKLGAALVLTLSLTLPVQADDAAEARAIVDKAVQATGGEAALSKFKGSTGTMKGDLYANGVKTPFTGELATQGADQQKVTIEMDVMGQKFHVVQVLNRDRGWVKFMDQTIDMDAAKLTETKEDAHAGWVSSLVALKDKAYTLATVGEIEVDRKPALGVRVSHAGRRDVNLFFDKTTHLLVKIESRVKDEQSGQEMTQESFLSGYEGKDIKLALKLTMKRDGKLFIESELSNVKLEEKLDDSVFAKP